jgi:bifunctional DNase/RNase
MGMVEMEVDSVRKSIGTHAKVLILREKEGKRYLPIWITEDGAESIAVWQQHISVPRPLTHDFILNLLHTVGLQVEKAIMSKLENDTHYAILVLTSSNGRFEIDGRPSDAVAVAVRAGAPIFADEEVLNKAAVTNV